MDENVDIIAVKPLDEVRHSLKFLYERHIWWAALSSDQVWASCGPRDGRNNNNNNNNCGLMEFVNIVIKEY